MLFFVNQESVQDPSSYPAFTSAWTHLDAFFETMVWHQNKILNLELHMQRVSRSCQYKSWPDRAEDFIFALQSLSEQIKEKHARLKLIYDDKNFYLSVKPLADPGKQMKSLSIENLQLQDYSFGYKHCDYRFYLEQKSLAESKGFDDALLVEDGVVLEATTANLYFVDKLGNIVTPALSKNLAGVTRQALIKQGLVKEKVIEINDLGGFDSCFMSNAWIGVQPVIQIATYHYSCNNDLYEELNQVSGHNEFR